MKTKNIEKKLSISKNTIVNLSSLDLKEVLGGSIVPIMTAQIRCTGGLDCAPTGPIVCP